jgi:membrane complex biogenesis BtpA family protein
VAGLECSCLCSEISPLQMAETNEFLLTGVLHLPALPGAPASVGGFQSVVDHALRDAEALFEGGIHSCVIENFGDSPFRAGVVQPHVPAMLAVIAAEVHRRFSGELQVGINVLRNDAHSALGAAVACGASFIRVNVLTGAAWTDQGLIQGQADSVLRYRRALCGPESGPRIMADVRVKHAIPAGETDLSRLAIEAVERGGADGVIVTGQGTGLPTEVDDVRIVRAAVPSHPVWVGSGVRVQTIRALVGLADGAIVGTCLHRDGQIEAEIDENRVRSLVEAARS